MHGFSRRAAVFRRAGSCYWQARFWIGDRLVRRSTRARTRAGAEDGLRSWRLQYERRGAPNNTRVVPCASKASQAGAAVTGTVDAVATGDALTGTTALL